MFSISSHCIDFIYRHNCLLQPATRVLAQIPIFLLTTKKKLQNKALWYLARGIHLPWTGDKPHLSQWRHNLLTHICVTRPRWVPKSNSQHGVTKVKNMTRGAWDGRHDEHDDETAMMMMTTITTIMMTVIGLNGDDSAIAYEEQCVHSWNTTKCNILDKVNCAHMSICSCIWITQWQNPAYKMSLPFFVALITSYFFAKRLDLATVRLGIE